MMPGKIVGIAGFKGTGKTTLAEAMIRYGWAHDSFAAPLRRFVCNLFDINLLDLDAIKETPQHALGGRTPRQVMQLLGTEWMRDYCGQDVWVNALWARVAPLLGAGVNVVISDVRFENEVQFIRHHGGSVVWLERPDCRSADGHISERGFPPQLIDHRIENDRDLDHLRTLAKILATLS